MPYTGLSSFVTDLEKHNELSRVTTFVDPVYEIAEVADRMIKSGGKALLFENNGTPFPILINAYGSDSRMAMALGRVNLDDVADDLTRLFSSLTGAKGNIIAKISALPSLLRMASFLPLRRKHKGLCQQVVYHNPDLSIFPVLKCWPHDGGKFITLPVVHTINPLSGKPNAGMYRMQIIDNKTTAMHWQRHKTGANHFIEWKKTGKKMPVAVTLGGDPVYAYSASAPLPEDIDEYILAGFLRRKRVKLVRCLTNGLYVPADADIVIEGYVDPDEEPVLEGPFGDHTGFYSLSDFYPGFHVTCITHSRKALYPATIVGIPPMEDAWIAKATEKIFLAPMKLAYLPEMEDIHLPTAGVAHNLVIVKIRKSYPGQGKKVIGSLMGAGQMMFTKYLIVVSGDVNIRDYRKLFSHIMANTGFADDLQFMTGPLDVLDHASDLFTIGGKLGIDATVKMEGEKKENIYKQEIAANEDEISSGIPETSLPDFITGFNILNDPGLVVAGLDQKLADGSAVGKARHYFTSEKLQSHIRLLLTVDRTIDVNDLYTVTWQVLANTDPKRDVVLINGRILFIDGTIKALHKEGFPRKWPNVVCSDMETISAVDAKWNSLGIGQIIESPSSGKIRLCWPGNEEISTGREK